MTHAHATSSAAPSAPATRTSSNPAARPASNEGPREQQRFKEAFERQLNSAAKEGGDGDLMGAAAEAAANPLAPIAGIGQRDGSAGMAMASPIAADAVLQAQIDRMAAAIAETHGTQASSNYAVHFAEGTAPVAAALISKDAAGALIVQLVGPASGMLPGEQQRLAKDLADRLRQRKLRLASVHFA